MTSINIIKISKSRPDRKIIAQATDILNGGGIVVAPTETRYGMLGRADDIKVLEKIYELKKRSLDLPSALFVHNRDEIFELGCECCLAETLAQKFLPGPLTLVLRDKSGLPKPVVIDGKIGIRYSSSAVIAKLMKKTEYNFSATSANLSGGKNLETIEEISRMFKDQVDLYLDGGHLNALPSTVVDCSDEKYKILRTGAFTREEIKKKIVRL